MESVMYCRRQRSNVRFEPRASRRALLCRAHAIAGVRSCWVRMAERMEYIVENFCCRSVLRRERGEKSVSQSES